MNFWGYNDFAPMDIDVQPLFQRRIRKNKSSKLRNRQGKLMQKYGRSSSEGKWHCLTDDGRSRCSTAITIRQRQNMLAPPKNLCERCALQKKASVSVDPNPDGLGLGFLYRGTPSQTNKSESLKTKEGNMRRELWLRYYYTLSAIGVCYVCHKGIKYAEYKPGKVWADGVNSFTNNRPLCTRCHSAMGKTPMDEFKEKNHPHLLSACPCPIAVEWDNDYIIRDAGVQLYARRTTATSKWDSVRLSDPLF